MSETLNEEIFGATLRLKTLPLTWQRPCPHSPFLRKGGKRNDRFDFESSKTLCRGFPQQETNTETYYDKNRRISVLPELSGDLLYTKELSRVDSLKGPTRKLARNKRSPRLRGIDVISIDSCHKGDYCKTTNTKRKVTTRPRDSLSGSIRGPKTGRRENLVFPPKTGGFRRRAVYNFRTAKLINCNQSLIIWLQTRLLGVCFYSEYYDIRFQPFLVERDGWLMINRPLPHRLISQALWILSVVPNTANDSIFDRIIGES